MFTKEHCEHAVKTYVDEASDSIKSAFDKAIKPRRKTKYEDAKIIIEALSALSESGAARFDIYNRIRQVEPEYPEASLKRNLSKLCTMEYGEILRFDSNSGRYSFSDPIYRAYASALYKKGTQRNSHNYQGKFQDMLLKFLAEKFINDDKGSFRIMVQAMPKE